METELKQRERMFASLKVHSKALSTAARKAAAKEKWTGLSKDTHLVKQMAVLLVPELVRMLVLLVEETVRCSKLPRREYLQMLGFAAAMTET